MSSRKLILGLDIGVSSVGIALVSAGENQDKEIVKLAVRVVPEDPDFHGKFYSGLKASKNSERTLERGKRRNNHRFKLRRNALQKCLSENNMMPNEDLINIDSKTLYGLRAKAVEEKIGLHELGRVLLHLNQRRGFYSNRKTNSEEENSTEYKQRIEALQGQLNGDTIGQALYKELMANDNINTVLLRERTYLRSSYVEEFDRIWDCQRQFYPDVLTGAYGHEDNRKTLYHKLRNRIIFYQRPLKSAKSLVSNCAFEKHHKAINKSNPLYELYRIWQQVNDLSWKNEHGEIFKPSIEQKQQLAHNLFTGTDTNDKGKLSISKIKKFFGYGIKEKVYFNFEELNGAKTYPLIKKALELGNVENKEQYLTFNYNVADEKGGLFELWHIAYSLPSRDEVCKTLMRRFGFTQEQAGLFADKVNFNETYGNLSSRAIKKLLPHLTQGCDYTTACDNVGYDHSGYKTKIEVQDFLEPIKRNTLRNPVVEQILNQVVNSVNTIINQYGKPDEIRVELARELRNNAQQRAKMSKSIKDNKKQNDSIRERLKKEYNYNLVNGRDVKRYLLWQETEYKCLYCGQPITATDFTQGLAEIEHIIPKSRSFNDSMSNYILAHKKCNSTKNQETAYDFMAAKGPQALSDYVETVNKLYNNGKGAISKAKFTNLLCKGKDIPSDFVNRMMNDTQYISKAAVKLLKQVCENTYTTTGQVTDFLREQWGLKQILQEINLPKYKRLNQVSIKKYRDSEGVEKEYETIENWTKRDDHRHHAIDALICALTTQSIVFKLNNLNKIYQYNKGVLNADELQQLQAEIEGPFDIKNFAAAINYGFELPMSNLRAKAMAAIEDILISFKKPTGKILSVNINRTKNGPPQVTLTPRGRLHEATEMRRRLLRQTSAVKLSAKFYQQHLIVDPNIKSFIIEYLAKFDNDPKKAFDTKQLKKQPIIYKGKELKEVLIFEEINYKRVALNANVERSTLEKIVDKGIRERVFAHLAEHGNNTKEAFGNLEEKPIYLNKEKGITIKSVSIRDDSKVVQVRNSFVKTGANHHAIIYKDSNGNYNEKIVSFWEAVEMARQQAKDNDNKLKSIISSKNDPELGTFMYSIQINDLFVIGLKHSDKPEAEGEINFFDPKNRPILSAHLFRVQKLSRSDYNFRHHLETTVTRNSAELKGIVWHRITSLSKFGSICKIRLDHCGNLISVENPL